MQPLTPATTYHIFNHANGFENVFRENENFRFFLEKYRQYIIPVAETYAFCLMPNHFHLVVRMRKREVIEAMIRNKLDRTSIATSSNPNFSFSNPNSSNSNLSKVQNFGKVEVHVEDVAIERFLSKQFANFFSCYTQAFNKMYKRMGSLFIKNFKREIITDKEHFINVIVYTHRNPIHHGFCNRFTTWGYSSYNEIMEQKSDVVVAEKTAKVFGGVLLFEETHQRHLEKFNQLFDLETP